MKVVEEQTNRKKKVYKFNIGGRKKFALSETSLLRFENSFFAKNVIEEGEEVIVEDDGYIFIGE